MHLGDAEYFRGTQGSAARIRNSGLETTNYMKGKLTIFLVMSLSIPLFTVLGSDISYRGKISPYRILRKTDSALFNAGSYEQIIEEWEQGVLAHRKSKYTQRTKDLTDWESEGRISYSYYGFSLSDSDSLWVKSCAIRGVAFSWDSGKKKWKNEALHIEDKYAREQVSYGFLRLLGGINLGGIDLESLKFLGEEEKEGKICYLLSYNHLVDNYKRWGQIRKLSERIWVEKETFLPVKKRVEGNIAGNKYLLIITYQNYGQSFDFDLPAYVLEESAREKKTLESKVQTIIEEVAKLRGWQAWEIKDVKVEFAKKTRMKNAMHQYIRNSYSDQELYYEGEMFKWLGLIPKDAEYGDIVFDSSDSEFIAGLYDPQAKTILVADDLEPIDAELTLFHEIVHAFQDKKIGLENLSEKFKSNSNADMAVRCLVEGEAASLELEYLLNKSDETLKEWDDISSLIDERLIHGYSRNKVFYNVYGYGAIFIQNYLKKQSWDWRKLDELYQNYPETMEEIIHPDEYIFKAAIKRVGKNPKSTPSILESHKLAGWKAVYNNKLGEYGIFNMLDDKLPRSESKTASIGWNSDRIDVYENGQGNHLLVLQTKWDSPKDAVEFFESYKQWLKEKKFTVNSEETAKDIFVNADEGQLTACSLGKDYLIIAGTQDVGFDDFTPLVEEIFSKGLREKVETQPEIKLEPRKIGVFTIVFILIGVGLLSFRSFQVFGKKLIKIRKKPASVSGNENQPASGQRNEENNQNRNNQNV